MVIMASLGAGMLYLTSTSTFHELFANNNARAYYAAESGGRYVLAQIRLAYASDSATKSTILSTINNNQTFTINNNGGTFQIANWATTTSNPDTITFTSTGTVGSGFLQAKRLLSFRITPAYQSGGSSPGQGQGIVDLAALPDNVATGSMGFTVVNPGGNQAIEVTKDQGSGVNAEAYVFAPLASPNPFWLNWIASGDYSSYDLQVKIATGTLSGGNISTTIEKPTTYANGLVFRGINSSGQGQMFLGVSLVRNGMLVPPYPTPAGATPWAKSTYYLINSYVSHDGYYYQCTVTHTSNSNANKFDDDSAYWNLLTNANKPMIVLWRRDSNQFNGDGTWLAYMLLDQTSYIFDASGHTIDWSTVLVRVIEAASVKLNATSAPGINIGDTIAGKTIAGANGTAVVFRKINDSDGKVVLLLNNIVGTFTLPEVIVGVGYSYNTIEYRARDNYIWVFYTDLTNHSSNTTPLNNIRLGQSRDTISWPIINVQDWTTDADRFTLVAWNSNLNTSFLTSEYPGKTIVIMGSGNEAGAIIRTDLFTRPGPYATSGAFPGEIGLVSLGGSNDAFFDDFAYYIRGGSGSSGTDGSGDVYVSP